MPIPTRSSSLREPRKQTIARPTQNKSISTDKISEPLPRSIVESGEQGAGPTTTEATNSTGYSLEKGTDKDGYGGRRKSFLPQRSSSILRVDVPAARKVQHGGGSALPGTGSVESRRQSLLPSAISTSKLGTAPKLRTSPVKGSARLPSPTRTTRALSPTRRTEMPPPPLPAATLGSRTTRSSSLRQPVVSASTKSSSAAATLPGHARHRSHQIVLPPSKKHADPTVPTTPVTQRPKAFTTYQQSFSPRKPTATKPPTPTPSVSASSEPDASLLLPAAWPEIAALQTDLLQLSLFHASALQTQTEWRVTSEASLRKKYDSVAGVYRSVLGAEKSAQRSLNQQALSAWLSSSSGSSNSSVVEQIQLLSYVVQEVSDLTDRRGGRYTLAVAAFEQWFRHHEELIQAREKSSTGDASIAPLFIESMGPTWQTELETLASRLDLCSRQMQGLDVLTQSSGWGNSALVRTVTAMNETIHLMIDEIHAIRSIEAKVVGRERAWVSQLAGRLAAVPGERRTRLGVWKR